MHVILERLETSDEGTFGRITAGDLVLFTGELPWRENKNSVSCIPTGEYKVFWDYSPKFRRFMYELQDVKDRAEIKIHSANFMGDTEKGFKSDLYGCIALGEKLGTFDGQKVLLLSRPAIRAFETLLNMRPFTLEVRNA